LNTEEKPLSAKGLGMASGLQFLAAAARPWLALRRRPMKCDHIVLYKLSTNDDEKELEANRESLFNKYHGRKGQQCYRVNAGQDFPDDVKDGKAVGVYILSHTKDVVPLALSQFLLAQLQGANVKRINVACCKGALASLNKVKELCTELSKADKAAKEASKTTFLQPDLLVCGFTVNVTTFGLGEEYTETKLAEQFVNLEEIRTKGRKVGTVLTNWDDKKLHILHEQVDDGVSFALAVEELFREKIVKIWEKNKAEFIAKENDLKNPNKVEALVQTLELDAAPLTSKALKQKAVAEKIQTLDWATFFGKCTPVARLFVTKVGWDKFLEKLAKSDSPAAKVWKSLDEYAQRKKAMKYDGTKFAEVPLSQYSEKEAMKDALAFVELAKKSAGGSKGREEVSLKFLPVT